MQAGGVNAEQRRAWEGSDGDNWTDHERWYNDAARYLTPPLFEKAGIAPTERVLDIGCGTGQTTREAARRAAHGSAFGIDLSSRMIERARKRAAEERVRNVRFEHGDAQVHPFRPAAFDVAISRNGAMFFDDPIAAFSNIASALRAGGRLAVLCWREIVRNEWLREIRAALAAGRDLPEPPPDAPSPFSLADPDRVRPILSAAGFEDITFDPVDEPIFFGADAATAFDGVAEQGVARGLLEDLDADTRRAALERLRQTIADHETPEGVLFSTSAWLVRAMKAGEKGES